MPYIIYLFFINIAAAIMCIYDKHQARKDGWRISEKALFAVSLAGGAVGMYTTMLKIRHKTRHRRFMIGLPLIIILQIAVFLYIAIDNGLILS